MDRFKIPIQFDREGLVPAVLQDHLTGDIRMVAYASKEAIAATLSTGKATIWSRSRNKLWEKGKTSGNSIRVVRVLVDCDDDCVIYCIEPKGPTCHTGAPSCFFQTIEGGHLTQNPTEPQQLIARLEGILEARKNGEGTSYTKTLFEKGAPAIGEAIFNEAGAFAHALAQGSKSQATNEAADVVFHLMIGLAHKGVAWRDVLKVLDGRMATIGAESGSNVEAERKISPPPSSRRR